MVYDNFILLIPALDPDENMIELIHDLHEIGFYRIAITDDGSNKEARKYFDKAKELGVEISHHERRMGKGTALRTAIQTANKTLGNADFYIMVDCDGQHTPDDVEKIAKELLKHPDHFVLGIRKFEKIEGKKVSYWVNYCQRKFFKAINSGRDCPDPRSGLRGFSSSFKNLALTTEGNSFDYEMNFLDSIMQLAPVSFIPISAETYTQDKTSHFRPVLDLLGLYIKFWRYLLTSNIATIFDLILFVVFETVFSNFDTFAIFLSTVCARILSGIVGYVLNRYISFRSHLKPGPEMIRYFIVFIGQMAASGIIVSILDRIPIPTVLIKAIVDFCLFFAVYNIQNSWVFRPEKVE